MNTTKIPGILGAVICIATFATNFYQIHFGINVPPPNILVIDVIVIKWVCAGLTLMSLWALATIIRTPVPMPGRPR